MLLTLLSFGGDRLSRQLEVRFFLHLSEKDRGSNVQRRADIKDGAQRRVSLAAFDQANEGPLVPRLRG